MTGNELGLQRTACQPRAAGPKCAGVAKATRLFEERQVARVDCDVLIKGSPPVRGAPSGQSGL